MFFCIDFRRHINFLLLVAHLNEFFVCNCFYFVRCSMINGNFVFFCFCICRHVKVLVIKRRKFIVSVFDAGTKKVVSFLYCC